jgi:hypothetical protein
MRIYADFEGELALHGDAHEEAARAEYHRGDRHGTRCDENCDSYGRPEWIR